MKNYHFEPSRDDLTIEEYDKELDKFLDGILPENFIVTDFGHSNITGAIMTVKKYKGQKE